MSMYDGEEWVYNGHQCSIEDHYEEDNIKTEATVITPDGKQLWPDISPYRCSPELVNLWIDAGYPKREGIGPLNREDLERIIEQTQLANEVIDEIIEEERRDV